MESDIEIIFNEEEVEYLNPNYDDSLVIFVMMIIVLVKRDMIDIDSSANILYFDIF